MTTTRWRILAGSILLVSFCHVSGEVGLIFASIGASLMLHGMPIIDSATYGAVVIMVVLTTLVTPPLIKWRFSRVSPTQPY